MATVTINKTMTFTGNKSIIITNGKVVIDGVDVTKQTTALTVEISGNVEKLSVDACNILSVTGNVGSISSSAGDIKVTGNSGTIQTQSGDVDCGDVTGSITTMSGDVDCGKISGSVSSMTGDIK